MVHSGMNASALYLFERLYSLAKVCPPHIAYTRSCTAFAFHSLHALLDWVMPCKGSSMSHVLDRSTNSGAVVFCNGLNSIANLTNDRGLISLQID